MERHQEPVDIFMRHGDFEREAKPNYKEFQEFLSNPNAFPLSERGKQEVKKAVETLQDKEQISLILSSPYLRTRETALTIQEELKNKYGKEIPIKIVDQIREIDIHPDILSEKEFRETLKRGGAEAVADIVFEKWRTGKGGELPEKVEQRTLAFLKFLRRTHKWTGHDRVLTVSHASFGRALRRVIEGDDIILPREKDRVLKTAGMFHIVRDTSKEKPGIPGIQPEEFIVIALKQEFEAEAE